MNKPTTLHCSRCSHSWEQRSNYKPLSCPKCKSYTWAETIKIIKRAVTA